jgi:hypothetical protein
MIRNKPFIYRVECDFCFRDQDKSLFFVDLPDDIQTYTACMACIEEKGWNQ